jgi:hypothetical protein
MGRKVKLRLYNFILKKYSIAVSIGSPIVTINNALGQQHFNNVY